jgi:uncharacterized membrane protein YgcG
MKKNLTITSAVAAVLVLGACGQAAQNNDWDDDNTRYCVDDDGDILPASACDNGGHGGAFIWIYGHDYSSKYPKKYKSYSSKVSKSYRAGRSGGSGASRGISGTSARSFSGGGSFGG